MHAPKKMIAALLASSLVIAACGDETAPVTAGSQGAETGANPDGDGGPTGEAEDDTIGDEAMTITGTIADIENGTDGSTVTMTVAGGSEIQVVISIPNLGPETDFDFASIEPGAVLTVSGDAYELDGRQHLTAWEASVAPTVEGEIVAVSAERDSTVVEMTTAEGVVTVRFGPLDLDGASDFIYDWLVVGNTVSVTGQADTTGGRIHIAAHAARAVVEGEITRIDDGADGATVELATADGSMVEAVISIANLGPDSSFDLEALALGARLTLIGDTYDLDGTTHLTVSEARSS